MKIRITQPGLYGAEGPIPVGTEIEVTKEPVDWAGRYELVDRPAPKGSDTAIVNPFNADKASEEELRAHLADKGVTIPDGATVKDLRALAKK